jgi:Holliday junction resolvasome RuvABC ATP-dependent DNA helicase subunit
MSQGVLPAQVMSAVAQPLIGQSALDRQQMMAQQEAMDLALAAEAQAADKKKKMLMYGAAGLGVVALAFIFLRRRG